MNGRLMRRFLAIFLCLLVFVPYALSSEVSAGKLKPSDEIFTPGIGSLVTVHRITIHRKHRLSLYKGRMEVQQAGMGRRHIMALMICIRRLTKRDIRLFSSSCMTRPVMVLKINTRMDAYLPLCLAIYHVTSMGKR